MSTPQPDTPDSAAPAAPLGFGDVTATVGDHIAHFFRGDDQRFSVLGPYIRAGLQRGDRCVFISRPNDGEALCDWLAEQDVDVEAARAADRLLLHPGKDTEEDMKRLVDRIDEEAREDEEPFVRWSGDGEWALDRELTVCEMLRWERSISDGRDRVLLECAGKPSTTSIPPTGACSRSASLTSRCSTAT